MKWTPIRDWQEAQQANEDGTPIRVANAQLSPIYRKSSADVLLRKGGRYRFSTAHIDAVGDVLDIDHGAVYPVRMEYKTASGDKRIVSFSPDEFQILREVV